MKLFVIKHFHISPILQTSVKVAIIDKLMMDIKIYIYSYIASIIDHFFCYLNLVPINTPLEIFKLMMSYVERGVVLS